MKEEDVAELDLYKYRIKKLYKYNSYGGETEKFYTQRKIPFLGWVYFPGSPKVVSPFDWEDRENYGIWYWIITSVLGAGMITLALVCLFSAKTWTPLQGTLLSLYIVSGAFLLSQILFFYFGYKCAFSPRDSEQRARERIYKRAEYWQKIRRRRRYEIIEVSLKNERKRKLEKIK